MVIKLLEGTQGIGVVLAENQKAAESVIEAFMGLKANILAQEFIREAGGADMRCFVIGEKVYGGMVLGEHNRPMDLEVNPLKAKQLTNIRAAGKDDAILLTPPTRLTLEQALTYIADDELVEVTPETIRLRKRYLDPHERKKQARRQAVA